MCHEFEREEEGERDRERQRQRERERLVYDSEGGCRTARTWHRDRAISGSSGASDGGSDQSDLLGPPDPPATSLAFR